MYTLSEREQNKHAHREMKLSIGLDALYPP